MNFKFLILTFIFYLNFGESANILCIFPLPAYSHQLIYSCVAKELLAKGHNLTVITTHPSKFEHKNATIIDVSFVIEMFDDALENAYGKGGFVSFFRDLIEITKKQIEFVGIQNLIQNGSNFDLMIVEATGMHSPFHAFAEHFNIPVVGITSSDGASIIHEYVGNVVNPIAHPDRILPFLMARSFGQRLKSCIFFIFAKYFINPLFHAEYERLIKENFPKITKTSEELNKNFDLLLINTHPALGYIRPLLPNTIQLGFIHIDDPKLIPHDLKIILDKSLNGVIFVSFGTVVKSNFMRSKIEIFLKAFESLPYDILWKYDGDKLDFIPKNVILRKWFPQSDLLAHENVKLFITHGVSLNAMS